MTDPHQALRDVAAAARALTTCRVPYAADQCEAGAISCLFCDAKRGHSDDCLWTALRAKLDALDALSFTPPRWDEASLCMIANAVAMLPGFAQDDGADVIDALKEVRRAD